MSLRMTPKQARNLFKQKGTTKQPSDKPIKITPIFDFIVKDRQTTRQGLKRKYEQMEWQNEQIRFFSNSGVYRVGSNGNY